MQQVPGLADLHRMSVQLLSERVPQTGRVLVLGAGGGLELRAFAQARPGWHLDGVDPSADMLALAERAVSPHSGRVTLQLGTIGDAPDGPFDGATSILTFHFIPREQRLDTLLALRKRLKPGAPLVLAHISFSQEEPERSLWIARHVAYGAPAGADAASLEASRQAIATRLSILAPEEEESMLAEAGFSDVSLFYAGLSFRGWVAEA